MKSLKQLTDDVLADYNKDNEAHIKSKIKAGLIDIADYQRRIADAQSNIAHVQKYLRELKMPDVVTTDILGLKEVI